MEERQLLAVVLSTEFTGRTVAARTASDIPWTTNGVANPGDLTVQPAAIPELFDTANAQGHFAPDRNTGNEGPWNVDIPLVLNAGTTIALESVDLDWQHFNNSGNFQTVNRSVDWTVEVTGSTSGVLGTATALNVNAMSGVETLSFTPALNLTTAETYTLNIDATGSNTTGNNTGLDAITINGTVSTTGGGGSGALVYEGFQYQVAGADRGSSDLLHGQPNDPGGTDIDATGLGGTWQDSTAVNSNSDWFIASGSLTFGDLTTTGNHVRGDNNLNNDLFSRPITTSLSAGSELWFSVLANKLQNNNSAAEGGLVIANQVVANNRILLNDGSDGLAGFGVAPTTSGNNWTPYAWNGSSQLVGDAALTVPTNGSETHLLVGKIVFDAGAGGTDQFTLYDYQLNAGSVTGGTLAPIASTIEVDVNQTTLDTLSLTRQVNTAYDEIRIGTTLDDVLGLNFTDTTDPLVTGFSPANGATDVVIATNLNVVFNEDVAIGTGNITVKNLTDSTQTTIDVTDSSQVSVSGNVLVINPGAHLELGKDYAIQIAATAVEDLAGNGFAGIGDDATWAFTTINTAPTSGLLVYEAFQYEAVNDSLHGQPDDPGGTDTDALGFGGTWTDDTGASGNMFLKSGSLTFGDLSTAGNHVGFESNLNNDIFYRDLTANTVNSLSGGSEIWFSILFEKLQNNNNAGEGGFVLGNQVLANPRILENDAGSPLNGLTGIGFGPTTAGDDLTAYAWDGTNIRTGDAAISVPPNNGTSNTNGSNLGPVHLVVGHLSFDSGAGGTDEFTLYDYQLNAGSLRGGTLSPIASTLEVNVDQSALNTVNLTRQVNLNYDELRIGSTLDDVLGLAAFGLVDDDYTASNPITEDQTLSIPDGPNDLFANDTLSGPLAAFDPFSVNGAAVTVNADGSFTYDPTSPTTIQALNDGQGLTDTFTYTIAGPEVLVDFSAAVSTPGGPQGGNHWNTIGVTTPVDLLNAANGADSGWDIVVTDGGGATGFGGTAINGDGDAAPFDQSFAIIDGIFSNRATAAGTSTIRFSNLHPNTAYAFSTYSDRASAWANSLISTTVGSGPTSVALLEDTVTNFTITADGSGVIEFTFVEGPGESSPAGNNSVLNALRMTEVHTATASVRVNGVTDALPQVEDDDYTGSNPITEDQTLSIPAGPNDLFANDTLTGPLAAFDAVSANGAAVTVNTDGSFTYDPTGAAALQALDDGQSLTDTFTYSIGGPGVLVDFSAALSTPGGLQGGNHWNTVGVTTPVDLLNAATGADSGWDIQVTDGGGATGFGGTAINGDGDAAPFDQSFAIIDGIFSNRATAAGTSTIRFTNLNPNTTYAFSTYSDRESGWADSLISTTIGTGPASVALLKDSVTTFTITADGSGVIEFTFVEGPGESANAADNSVLNALRMTEASTATASILVNGVTDVVPEVVDDDYTASNPLTEDQTLSIPDGPNDLFANDTLTGALTAFDALSANGGTVVVNGDGSFTYDPTGSTSLQSLSVSQSVTDTFTYSIQGLDVLVDFSAAVSTPGGLQGGNHWNTVGVTTPVDLLNAATGIDSGWDIQVTDGGGATGFGGTAINGDGDAAPFDQSFAIIDGIFSNRATAAGTSTIRFTNLTANTPYAFSTYSDRATAWADSLISTTVGSGPASVALLKDSVTNFTITSDGSGVIEFTFVEGPGESSPVGDNSVLNALRMTEIATATASILVNGANDPPTAVDDTNAITEQAGDESSNVVSGNLISGNGSPNSTPDSDPDTNDTLSVDATDVTSHVGTYGTLTITNADGSYVYELGATPAQNTLLNGVDTGATVMDTFAGLTITDGNGGVDTSTLTITISGATDNQPPVITQGDAPISVTMDEDGTPTAFTVTIAATDPNASDVLTWTLAGGGAATNGSVTVSGTGNTPTVNYSPNANYHGTDSFVVQVSDGNGGSDTLQVDVTINEINDPATFSGNTSGTGTENGPPVTGTLIATDAADGMSSPNYTISSPATQGNASIDSAGNWSYTPDPSTSGADSFTVQVTDDNGNNETQVISITITPAGGGGGGEQVPVFIDGAGNLVANGTTSADEIIVTAGNKGTVYVRYNDVTFGPFSVLSNLLLLNGNDSDDRILIAGNLPGNPRTMIDAGPGTNYVAGGRGDDTITSHDGNDVLLGGGGNDTISGGGGNDKLDGGSGDDVLNGDDGNDSLVGGSGNDTVNGGAGIDLIAGGSGDDTLDGGDGDDVVSGGSGNDIVRGGDGADRLFGRQGRDILVGDANADALLGNEGDDLLVGGRADDDLDSVRILWLTNDFTTAAALVVTPLAPTGDGAPDGLNGHTGRDLFFTDGPDGLVIRGDDVFVAV